MAGEADLSALHWAASSGAEAEAIHDFKSDARPEAAGNILLIRPLLFAGRDAPAARARALEARGAEVVRPPDGAADWTPAAVLAELGRREIAALLVEGGSRVLTSFVEARLADKAVLTYAPRLIGGEAAPGLVGGRGAAAIGLAAKLARTRAFTLEDDIVVEGYF